MENPDSFLSNQEKLDEEILQDLILMRSTILMSLLTPLTKCSKCLGPNVAINSALHELVFRFSKDCMEGWYALSASNHDYSQAVTSLYVQLNNLLGSQENFGIGVISANLKTIINNIGVNPADNALDVLIFEKKTLALNNVCKYATSF